MKDKIFLLDSNVLIYAYEKEETERKKKAKELINRCLNGKIKLAVSAQNLAEFTYVSIKKGKAEPKEIKVVIKNIIEYNGFIDVSYNSKTVLEALIISNDNKILLWDALIIATMKENNISSIYTENVEDFNISGIEAINPFTKDNKISTAKAEKNNTKSDTHK